VKALYAFSEWLAQFSHRDTSGRLPPELRLSIHSRSDAHSVRLAELVLDELLDTCLVLREQAARGDVCYGINYRFRFSNGKFKTLDFVVGIPVVHQEPVEGQSIRRLRSHVGLNRTVPDEEQFSRLLIACELKSVLTEHRKSQPRVFDELNGSHAIVHGGSRDTLAAGMTLVNIAETFVSPLRQARDRPIFVSRHQQPADAATMVDHLRGLPRRSAVNPVGFDAYCSFVMDVDNQGHVALWTAQPAPQPGEGDHFDRFLSDLCQAYRKQFSDLDDLPEASGLGVEEALTALSLRYPDLLSEAGQVAVDANLAGAPELRAILQAIELQARADARQ
jgi:hypothetical protein